MGLRLNFSDEAEFDIRKCFHTIDRHRLIPIFKEEIGDPKFFYPIQKVFSAGRLIGAEKGRRWEERTSTIRETTANRRSSPVGVSGRFSFFTRSLLPKAKGSVPGLRWLQQTKDILDGWMGLDIGHIPSTHLVKLWRLLKNYLEWTCGVFELKEFATENRVLEEAEYYEIKIDASSREIPSGSAAISLGKPGRPSGTLSRRRSLKERLGPRHARSMSGSPEPRRGRSKSPREKGPERRTLFKRLEKGVFHRLGDKEKNVSAHSRDSRHRASSRRAEALSESEGSAGGHWKSKPKKQKSSVEDDLS
ncbi:hypothetical protein Tco_0385107 [Tanacetum coccineum]